MQVSGILVMKSSSGGGCVAHINGWSKGWHGGAIHAVCELFGVQCVMKTWVYCLLMP